MSGIGLFLGMEGEFVGWLFMAAFGSLAVRGLRTFRGGAPTLTLSPEGFATEQRAERWVDVDGHFETIDIGWFNWPLSAHRVAYDVKRSLTTGTEQFARGFSGHARMLPGNYGKKAADLAELMNQWKHEQRTREQ
jgi:hypothetical protein